MKYILFFDSLNLPQIISIWVKLVRRMNYIVHFSKKMKLNSILISYSTSTKTLRLQIHLKLFKEAFWSWQETSWGLLTGYLVDNLKSAFLTFTNIKNINHQECFFVNLDYYFKVILRLTLLPIVTTHWWQFSIQSTKLNKRPQFIGK